MVKIQYDRILFPAIYTRVIGEKFKQARTHLLPMTFLCGIKILPTLIHTKIKTCCPNLV